MTDSAQAELEKSQEVENQRLEAQKHAQKMRVPVDNSKSKCVDGGYQEDQEVGAMAIPGGDLGVSMALLRVGYSPAEAFSLVKNFVVDRGGKYSWHSDTHAEPSGHDEHEDHDHEHHHDKPVVGCGHCNAAISQAEQYGVKSEDVSTLLSTIRNEQDNMNLVVLDREHEEKAILVVTSSDFTVKPWDQEDNNQYFIYDANRHQQFLKEFVAELAKNGKNQVNGQEVTFDSLWAASQEQTNATLGLLKSSKGKPMFTVDVSSEIPEVKLAGFAPVIEAH
ncbi:hypothetical protein KJZ63_01815 [Patescibacteria group bacterium]|nr:hypothetical protein [Patescibacteria group bacterium]